MNGGGGREKCEGVGGMGPGKLRGVWGVGVGWHGDVCVCVGGIYLKLVWGYRINGCK